MFGQRATSRAIFALIATLLPSIPLLIHAEERTPARAVVQIGMINTLFRDIPQPTVNAMLQPLGALIVSQTGVAGELVVAGDAEGLGKQLAEENVQLGVFHGIEFAWARQKHPELRPLVIAINQDRYLRAHLVVRSDSPVGGISELQAKKLAVAVGTREHCHLFLRRQCQLLKKSPRTLFDHITVPPSAEEALDDVVDGVAQTTVVDGVAFECYKRRKPGRFSKLRILNTSDAFPAAVVGYRPGVLDESTLKRFHDGMIHANQNIIGRHLMTLWKLTAFEEVPPDYDQMCAEIVKVYPPASAADAK